MAEGTVDLTQIPKPEAGQQVVVPVEGLTSIPLNFNLADATLVVEGGNLVIQFDDGATIVLEGIVREAADSGKAPNIVTADGEVIPTNPLLASLGVTDEDFATAAGGGGGGAGGSGGQYRDDMGNLLGGYDALNRLDADSFRGDPPAVGGRGVDDPGNINMAAANTGPIPTPAPDPVPEPAPPPGWQAFWCPGASSCPAPGRCRPKAHCAGAGYSCLDLAGFRRKG